MKKSILILITILTLVAFLSSCSSSPESTKTETVLEKPKATKNIWVRRHGELIPMSEDSLKASFKVIDPIDNILVSLNDSMQKRGKYFNRLFATFEKITTDTAIICYLYPEFISKYDTDPQHDGYTKTKMTIIMLKKNVSYLMEIESPMGSDNVYHKAKKVNEVVSWITKTLCNDNRDQIFGSGDSEQLYNPEMQVNGASHVSFKGIDSSN